MQIRIVSVGPTESKQGKTAAYSVFELTFSVDGKERTRKIMSFDREIFKTLKASSPGEVYEVNVVQEGKFYNWKEVKLVSGAAAAAASTTSGARSGGNWETPEERAKKQVYIVRQSSIASAIAYHANSEAIVTVSDIIDTARKFEAYVFETPEPADFVGDEDVVM